MKKREAELLAQRIDLAVDEIRKTASLMMQSRNSMKAEVIQAGVDALDDLVLTIKFDALRIEKLTEEDSLALRDIHRSMCVAIQQSGLTRGGLYHIKQTIEALFPGEVLEP